MGILEQGKLAGSEQMEEPEDTLVGLMGFEAIVEFAEGRLDPGPGALVESDHLDTRVVVVAVEVAENSFVVDQLQTAQGVVLADLDLGVLVPEQESLELD